MIRVHDHTAAGLSVQGADAVATAAIVSLRVRRCSRSDDAPPPERESNLTAPDSILMQRSGKYEFRQAYNAQAMVCAEDRN